MIFIGNSNQIDFNITGYQYPSEVSSVDEYNYDANWLVCKIDYMDEKTKESYRDPALLTYELEELYNALSMILDGEDDSYISDFMEPYVKISIARNEKMVIFTFHFIYDTSGEEWMTRKVTSLLSKEEAICVLKELEGMVETYPPR